MTPPATGQSERSRRQLILWMIQDMDDIDETGPIGLYTIEHYRPKDTSEIQDEEAIRRWIETQYMEESGA